MRPLITLLLYFTSSLVFSQAIDVNSTLGLPRVTDANGNGLDDEIDNEDPILSEGNLVYNTTDDLIYRYDGANWVAIAATDDQYDDEVLLRTPINVDGTILRGGIIEESNVEQVIQAIAPITSKAGRVFYPPSIEIDASEISTTDQQINLHTQYTNQFDITSTNTTINIGGTAINYETAKSTSAPDDIPTYAPDELFYYVTFADTSVFDIISLDDNGILTYRITGIPSGFNTIINVVFVVK